MVDLLPHLTARKVADLATNTVEISQGKGSGDNTGQRQRIKDRVKAVSYLLLLLPRWELLARLWVLLPTSPARPVPRLLVQVSEVIERILLVLLLLLPLVLLLLVLLLLLPLRRVHLSRRVRELRLLRAAAPFTEVDEGSVLLGDQGLLQQLVLQLSFALGLGLGPLSRRAAF